MDIFYSCHSYLDTTSGMAIHFRLTQILFAGMASTWDRALLIVPERQAILRIFQSTCRWEDFVCAYRSRGHHVHTCVSRHPFSQKARQNISQRCETPDVVHHLKP